MGNNISNDGVVEKIFYRPYHIMINATSQLQKVQGEFFNKKFIGFCLIGILNTFNTAFFSWLAHLRLQENISAYIGYFVSLSVNYVLNSLIVFKNRLGIRRYLRFLLSYIPNFVIYTLVTLLTINVCNMDQFWATVLATMAGAPITFVIIKLYAFGKVKGEKSGAGKNFL